MLFAHTSLLGMWLQTLSMKNLHASQQGLKIHHVYGVKDGAAGRPRPAPARQRRVAAKRLSSRSLSFPPEHTAILCSRVEPGGWQRPARGGKRRDGRVLSSRPLGAQIRAHVVTSPSPQRHGSGAPFSKNTGSSKAAIEKKEPIKTFLKNEKRTAL